MSQESIEDVKQELDNQPSESSPETDVQAAPSTDSDESLPFGKHPRWQEVLKERNEARTQYEKTQQDLKLVQDYVYQNRQAIDFWNSLSKDKERYEAVQKVLAGELRATQNDPYSEYDPLIAEKLRKLDQMEKAFQQMTTQQKQEYEDRQINDNFNTLESTFFGMCDKAQIKNESDQQVLAALVAVTLQGMMPGRDIRYANIEMLNSAWKQALPMLDSVRKQARASLTIPTVPPSGSRTGQAPRKEGIGLAPQDRIQELLSSMGG